jgi:Uma2 family endonuclease
MVTITLRRGEATSEPPGRLPSLENGERMDQPTFHERYQAMPEETRAELIGGIVYIMASPVGPLHGLPHGDVVFWLRYFTVGCPLAVPYDNTTHILGLESEPQPDASLLLLPEYGGRARVEVEAIVGPPEVIVEVARSSRSYDLNQKKADYEAAGVPEYVVVVADERVHWFVLEGDRYVELSPEADGLYRSRVFPGLWLDPEALLRGDAARLREVVDLGLASPEHLAWRERLQR